MRHGATIKIWDPIWRTHQPKQVEELEYNGIKRLIKAIDIPAENVSAMINAKGEKVLRIKIFKHLEQGILVYDYYFFGPIVLEHGKIFLQTTTKINSRLPADHYLPSKEVTVLLNEKEFARHIRQKLGFSDEHVRMLG